MEDEIVAAKNTPTSSNSSLWIVIGVLAFGMLVGRAMRRQQAGDAEIGQPMPPLNVAGWLNADQPVTNELLAGQVVLVDCWATWCGPCRAKMPGLVDLKERFRNQDVVVLGLTEEPTSQRTQVEKYINTVSGLDWPIAYGSDSVFSALQVYQLPTLFVFDRHGKLAWKGHGLKQAEDALVAALAMSG